jgi:ATP-dependent DNA ligase
MPLARLHAPFDHPDWLFELKYDGFRGLAYIEAGGPRLVSRKGNTYKSFGGLCASIAAELGQRSAVLGGEIVYLDGDGRPQFYSLLRRRGRFPRVSCEQDLEGVVAKLKVGLYTPDATTWVKIRNPQYSQMEGRRELFEKPRSTRSTSAGA